MRTFLALIVGIGVVAGVAYLFIHYAPSQQPIVVQNYPSSGKNVIAFGDSLVKGVGSTPGNDFVSLISKELQIPIINEGVVGNTSAQALNRIDDVLEQDPKVVLVLVGGNDILQKVPSLDTFKNIETIIQKIHEKGAVVILLGVPAGILSDPYQKEFRALAEKYNTAYVPNILSGLIGRSDYMSDTIHPNDMGYKKIAELITPVVKKLTK